MRLSMIWNQQYRDAKNWLWEQTNVVLKENGWVSCRIVCSISYSQQSINLVRHLVELRFRQNELKDMLDDPTAKPNDNTTKVILGHHFTRNLKHTPTSRQFCDHCSGIIWSVVQASYICTDCSFRVHHKCVQLVIRICAHVVVSERNGAIEDICPEVGLAIQGYKCAECEVSLNFSKSNSLYITF